MRRSGQTFRALLGSLKLASEGKNVIYECGSLDMAKWTFDKAADIVTGFTGGLEITGPLTLKIGDGSVRFTKPLSDLQFRECAKRIKDFEFVRDV